MADVIDCTTQPADSTFEETRTEDKMTKNPFLTPEEIKEIAGHLKTAFIATHTAWLIACRGCLCSRLDKNIGRVAREIDDCRKEILLDIEKHNGSCQNEEAMFSLNDWIKEAENR